MSEELIPGETSGCGSSASKEPNGARDETRGAGWKEERPRHTGEMKGEMKHAGLAGKREGPSMQVRWKESPGGHPQPQQGPWGSASERPVLARRVGGRQGEGDLIKARAAGALASTSG